MRKSPNLKANRYRVTSGSMASTVDAGNYGAFIIPQKHGPDLRCIVCAGEDLPGVPDEARGWEHVSVSTEFRCPTWEEMCLIKDLFWREDEVVFQLHPAKSEWINYHPYCLHLWRKVDQDPPLPPGCLVETKGDQNDS